MLLFSLLYDGIITYAVLRGMHKHLNRAKNNKYYILLTLFYAIFRCSHIDNHNILWYIKIV